MKKIRDFIYNYNDIFVALIIIALAALVILWRVGVIMDYTEYKSARTAPAENTEVSIDDIDLTPEEVDEYNKDPEDVNSEDLPDAPADPAAEPEPEQPSGEINFQVPSGSSADRIGDYLVQAGLIDSKQAFLDEVNAQNAATKIKAGTFKITVGTSVTDIVKILTK